MILFYIIFKYKDLNFIIIQICYKIVLGWTATHSIAGKHSGRVFFVTIVVGSNLGLGHMELKAYRLLKILPCWKGEELSAHALVDKQWFPYISLNDINIHSRTQYESVPCVLSTFFFHPYSTWCWYFVYCVL